MTPKPTVVEHVCPCCGRRYHPRSEVWFERLFFAFMAVAIAYIAFVVVALIVGSITGAVTW